MKKSFYRIIAITGAVVLATGSFQSFAAQKSFELKTEYLADKVTIKQYGANNSSATQTQNTQTNNTQSGTQNAAANAAANSETAAATMSQTEAAPNMVKSNIFGNKTGPGVTAQTDSSSQHGAYILQGNAVKTNQGPAMAQQNAVTAEATAQDNSNTAQTEAASQAVTQTAEKQYKTVEKRVTLDRVNVRKSPSTSAEVLGLIEGGREINYVKKYDSEWTQVKYNGKTGYIASRYIGTVKKKVEITAEEATANAAQTDTTSANVSSNAATKAAAIDTAKGVQEIGLNSSWKYAAASQIHTGNAVLYRASANRKDKIIGVNAGHGTKGGESVKTWSHPDKTAKVTGGTTAAGEVLSIAVSTGMTFKDGTAEAAVNLKVAQKLKDLLLADGYDVLMIRDGEDVQLDNIARTVICNNVADIHIAIHFDSDGQNYDKGAFYCSVPDGIKYLDTVSKVWEQSEKLGDGLINGLKTNGNKIYSYGSMDIDLTQTSFSTIPSVDLELGNACSDHDDRSINQKAKGILAGINEYFGLAKAVSALDNVAAQSKAGVIMAGGTNARDEEQNLPWKRLVSLANDNVVSIAEMTEKAMNIRAGIGNLNIGFLAANNTDYLTTQNKVEEHSDGSGLIQETQAAVSAATDETAEENVQKLTTLSGIAVGTVLKEAQIDFTDTSKYFKIWKIEEGDNLYSRINGKSYKKNNNIAASDLRYIKLPHYNFDGQVQVGEIIVNKSIAEDIVAIFKGLFDNKYQIYSLKLIDDFWTGDPGTSDDASCYANNSSAFCYRAATGSGKLSKHAMGLAIDINTQQNPYVTYTNGQPRWMHENANAYIDRNSGEAHMIGHNDLAYKLFTEHGFTWGGDWTSIKDYQHFEK